MKAPTINQTILGLLALVACGTVAQVWAVVMPAVAVLQDKQETVSDQLVYIRNRVDTIYDEMQKD
jgi:hypothetical protein